MQTRKPLSIDAAKAHYAHAVWPRLSASLKADLQGGVWTTIASQPALIGQTVSLIFEPSSSASGIHVTFSYGSLRSIETQLNSNLLNKEK